MQIRKLLLGCIALLIILISCTKNPEKVLPRQDGKWSYEVTTRVYDDNTGDLKSEDDGYGSFTFYDDGTYSDMNVKFAGVMENETYEGTWTLIAGDTLVLEYPVPSLQNIIAIIKAKIVKKKRNLQVWERTTIIHLSSTDRVKVISIYTLTKD